MDFKFYQNLYLDFIFKDTNNIDVNYGDPFIKGYKVSLDKVIYSEGLYNEDFDINSFYSGSKYFQVSILIDHNRTKTNELRILIDQVSHSIGSKYKARDQDISKFYSDLSNSLSKIKLSYLDLMTLKPS
jgi:superfamily I DNA and RNA helicase